MNSMRKTRKKYAFISYNHHDVLWAIRLKAKMIWFKLPSYIENEFKNSKYLEPVFRDRDYFTSGNLTEMIKRQLDNSRYLIVICSPHSAKSDWVNQEVYYFLNEKVRDEAEADPSKFIVPYVLLDEPYDIAECYPPALIEFIQKRKLNNKLLAIPKIDNEDKLTESWFARLFPKSFKTEKSFARVIAKVLGIVDEFDDIWNLHQRMLKRRWKIRGIIATLVLCVGSYLLYPLSITINISDERHCLPMPNDAVLSVNEIGYPLSALDTIVIIKDLPWYFLFKEFPIHFQATYYDSKDTTLTTSISHNSSHTISVKRDSTFGIYAGYVKTMDGKSVSGATVTISRDKRHIGRKSITNQNGYFYISFPTQEQRESMYCSVYIDGKVCYERQDEVPCDSLILPIRNHFP